MGTDIDSEHGLRTPCFKDVSPPLINLESPRSLSWVCLVGLQDLTLDCVQKRESPLRVRVVVPSWGEARGCTGWGLPGSCKETAAFSLFSLHLGTGDSGVYFPTCR